MTNALKSHANLAELLNMPLTTVVDLRKREGWPHVRIGRAVRFTDEHIAQIIATHTVSDAPAAQSATFGGQTRRSASRRHE